MSLYGALYAGVAGLSAQSNRIGIISDNIANVNTVGYKGNRGGFESLVTSSSSQSEFSPGGVVGLNQQLVDKQGLLQSTDSTTDIAISGDGFFVVNQQADGNGQVLYTRAGSFTPDSTGNFRNAAGFFLQAWPLDREGRLPGESGNLNTNSSANLSSLQTVNVNNLTGVAASTSTVSVGANLDASQATYPGAFGTVAPDPFHIQNGSLAAKDILVPGGPNSLTRGDRITISTGQGISNTYRYSGFTFGRDVTNASSVGDNGQAVISSPDTLTIAPAALANNPVTTGAAASTTVTITDTAHGLTTGDAVTLAGLAGVDGIPAGELNTTHIVTVVDANTYTITTTTGAAVGGVNGGGASGTQEPLPFTSTSGSNVIKVRHVGHGLVTGEVSSLSGNTGAFGGIPAGDLNSQFVVTVIDADHYNVTVASTATSTAGGGAGTVVSTTRLFSGAILDASNATTRFLANAGTSSFSSSALSFTLTTAATGTVTFTYTSASPNAQLGQFNTMSNLADAINSVVGLSARVSDNRLYIAPTDANSALTFANGASVGTAGPPVQWGIDWIRELGLADLSTGSDRFSSLEGLSNLVNNSSGLSASVQNALSTASVTINVDDPLDTITFSDLPAIANVTLGTTPFSTTVGSGVVTVTLPSAPTPAYATGDIIDMGTLAGGPYNGISAANLSGQFSITVVNSTTFTIVAKNGALATGGGLTGPTGISMVQPQNSGSLVAELGLVASLNNATYTAQTTGAIGPAYDPTDANKNMAGGAITSQFSRPIRVFDSLGTGHDLNMSFIKTAVNTWAVEIFAADATEVTSPFPNGQLGTGTLTFNGDGSLQSVSSGLANPVSVTWNNGAVSSSINFNWGTAGSPFGTPNAVTIGKTDGFSQFDNAYRVNFVNQNGAAVGDLTGVSITDEGLVVVSFSNGETQNLFRIPLADFANPNQLLTSSGNVFLQSAESGEVNLRQSGSSGVGEISASSLEQSNVELADQLTDMIVAQRAYQANTKVISTTDQLLSQLNDILR
ncbi:MAG: flagellar hook-basal body complex protein [Rickettsiales bacterium]